jgi:prepilin-type N-terminal cleavage/methylation domain-containing protein/prepilin-type processing-associated H-X9-DG protein
MVKCKRARFRSVQGAFTLVELLVVMAIIALLVGILLPALNNAKNTARATVCAANMRQLGLGVSLYAQDNNYYLPRSSHSAATYNVLRWGQAIMPYIGAGNWGDDPKNDPLLKNKDSRWYKLFYGMYHCPADKRRYPNKEWSYGKSVWFELNSSETGQVARAATGPTYWKFTNVRSPGATVEFGELASQSAMGAGTAADHIMPHFWILYDATPEVDAKRHIRKANYAFLDGHIQALDFSKTFDSNSNIDNWNPGTAQ